jgi:hypothetical protein
MTDGLRELADLLLATPGEPAAGLQFRQGVVTALAAGPPPTVTVRIGKAATAVPSIRYHSAYIPAVNDVVFLIQNGPDVLCLGTLASAVTAVLSPTDAAATYIAKSAVNNQSLAALEATTSTTYVDLATVGPAVSLTMGASGAALVFITARALDTIAGQYGIASFAISGGTTLAASDSRAILVESATAAADVAATRLVVVAGISGACTFTMKYRATAGTAQFSDRSIVVIPL